MSMETTVTNSGLHLLVFDDAEAVGRFAAERVLEALRQNPSLLLCAATGASPTRAYTLIAERYSTAAGLFAEMRVLGLDEWQGLPAGHPGSCMTYLNRYLIEPMHLSSHRFEAFDGNATDIGAECERIRGWLLENGPIDIAMLGMGLNGHLGFNEPADGLQPHAHLAELRPETRAHAMLGAPEAHPTHGFTLGMADVLQARRVLLPIIGRSKREILARLLASKVTPGLPASFLKLHPNVTVLADRDALG